MKLLAVGLYALSIIAGVAFGAGVLGLSVYGIYLAFCASVILGVAAFFVQPAPLVFGAVQFFFHVNLPVIIMTWLKAHGV